MEEVKLEIPELPESLKTEKARTYREWWPGKIAFAANGTAASGCRSVVFAGESLQESSDAFNKFFEVNDGIVAYRVDTVGTQIHLIYTKMVSPEQMSEFNEVEAEVHAIIEKRRADEAQAKAIHEASQASLDRAVKAKEDALRKENNRLMELGRVHEKNCKQKKGK